MLQAIDRYAVGIETEVNADDFGDQHYIPSRTNRFYCPECGEIVFFRRKGGSHPNHFYHKEKTSTTPECDRRIDGRSELSLNQRVGLPVFLTGGLNGSYHLNIGFPALGAETLRRAVTAEYYVEISSGNYRQTVKVDQTNFIEDSITLIPISFIPERRGNYRITPAGKSTIYGIQRKWSDYADGFEYEGAIFTYDETGGKKIRRGDSISANRDYYAVLRNTLPAYEQIKHTYLGEMHVGNAAYKVVKIRIEVTTEDKAAFSSISVYLHRHFGVWLLECQPELIPIWPPVVERDYYEPVKPNDSVVCAVSSGNANPRVYVYSDRAVTTKEVEHAYGRMSTIDLRLGDYPVVLSVDRKYVGREVAFLSKKQSFDGQYEFETELYDYSGNTVDWAAINSTFLSSDFSVHSNSKLELYTGTVDKTYRHIAIRDELTSIPPRPSTNELYMLIEGAVVRRVLWRELTDAKNDASDFTDLIAKSGKGRMVDIPRWAEYLIRRIKSDGHDELFQEIMTTIRNDKINVGSLATLRLLEPSILKREHQNQRKERALCYRLPN